MFVDTRDSMIGAMTSTFAKRLFAEADNKVRVALVGKVGVGKSALGNCILDRKAFQEKRALKAVTQESRLELLPWGGCELQIVDTPGLFDPKSASAHKDEIEKIQKEIIKSLALLAPGPHVILVVLSGYDRYTPADLAVYLEIQKLFPGSTDYIIFVFTHTESEADLEELLGSSGEVFEQLLQDCGRRVAAMETKSEHRQSQVRRLITKIQNLKAANRGNHYSNVIMKRCYDLMVSTSRPLEEIKQEVIAERSEMLERLYNNPETKSFLQRLFDKCTIL